MRWVKLALGALYRALGLAERAQKRRDKQETENVGRTKERADQQAEVLEDVEYAKRVDEAFDRLPESQHDRLRRRARRRRQDDS